MLSIERREAIKRLLLEEKTITVAATAKRFHVSSETVRRDFDALSDEGFLIKTYGGASLVERSLSMVPQHIRSGILVENKRRIAAEAVKQVKPGDCIFLDHSTTVAEMCSCLKLRQLPVTVMTNSLMVLSRLASVEQVKLVVTGGYFDSVSQGIFGLETVRFLQKHNVDKAFLSSQAMDMVKGISDSNEAMADLRCNAAENATEVFLLMDYTKFDKVAFTATCGFELVNRLITDKPVSARWKQFLSERDIPVTAAMV